MQQLNVLVFVPSADLGFALKANNVTIVPRNEVRSADDLTSEIRHSDYTDVVLLEAESPYVNLHAIRRAGIKTPIVGLVDPCGNQFPVRRADFLNAGGDDLLQKPFHILELRASLQAVYRRSKGHVSQVKIHHIADDARLVVDISLGTVRINGNSVHLTKRELIMLQTLSDAAPNTVTRAMFMSRMYGGRDEPESKVIDVFVCKLRKKLHDVHPGSEKSIGNVWGHGYKLVEIAQKKCVGQLHAEQPAV